jgi:hypothetical protein
MTCVKSNRVSYVRFVATNWSCIALPRMEKYRGEERAYLRVTNVLKN